MDCRLNPPATCFTIACKLRMVFTFLYCWKKISKEEYFVTCEIHTKFKCQCLLNWNSYINFADHSLYSTEALWNSHTSIFAYFLKMYSLLLVNKSCTASYYPLSFQTVICSGFPRNSTKELRLGLGLPAARFTLIYSLVFLANILAYTH